MLRMLREAVLAKIDGAKGKSIHLEEFIASR